MFEAHKTVWLPSVLSGRGWSLALLFSLPAYVMGRHGLFRQSCPLPTTLPPRRDYYYAGRPAARSAEEDHPRLNILRRNIGSACACARAPRRGFTRGNPPLKQSAILSDDEAMWPSGGMIAWNGASIPRLTYIHIPPSTTTNELTSCGSDRLPQTVPYVRRERVRHDFILVTSQKGSTPIDLQPRPGDDGRADVEGV